MTPHAARPIVDAPRDVSYLIARWIAEGMPWELTQELTRALQPHRGVRLLVARHVVWIRKASDRDDDQVCVAPRSWPLRAKGERTS